MQSGIYVQRMWMSKQKKKITQKRLSINKIERKRDREGRKD